MPDGRLDASNNWDAGLFVLGEKPAVEQLLSWLPDRWLLNQRGTNPFEK